MERRIQATIRRYRRQPFTVNRTMHQLTWLFMTFGSGFFLELNLLYWRGKAWQDLLSLWDKWILIRDGSESWTRGAGMLGIILVENLLLLDLVQTVGSFGCMVRVHWL